VSGLSRSISIWGLASLLLFLGSFVIFQYSFHLHDTGRPPLFSTLANYELCVVVQVAAAVCGFVAMKRGSKWSGWTAVPATLRAVGCYLSEL
jgi:hypothetical protein